VINTDRLHDSIETLGRIGAYDDPATGLAGVRRLALSDADRDARRLVVGWLEDAELTVVVDRIGNIYARRPGSDDTLDPVMIGSHVDSVPSGGRFDGALGVLGGLEVMRTLDEHGVRSPRPVVVAIFTEEEGCRFGTDMLGSAVATGRIQLDEAYGLIDADRRTVRDELERIGFLGDEAVGTRRPRAFLECHVEQGPTLIRSGHDVGIVTGVQGISWQELTITGQCGHAGATPTDHRHDAGLVASLINVRMREMAESGGYGDLRATMGVIRPEPGSINVVPGRVRATVDLRNPRDDQMLRAEEDLRSYAAELTVAHGVAIDWRRTVKTPCIRFDDTVQQVIAAAAAERGLSCCRLMSGAGHDAQEWAPVCPTGMIFVPGEHDGISHNPRELSTAKQCADGVNLLLGAVVTLTAE
jgi:N-carbamoyl-L-amino-acid hydrolase